MSSDQHPTEYVEALKAERVGYERTGRKDRLAAVDAEIARVSGAKAPGTQTRPRGAGASTRANRS